MDELQEIWDSRDADDQSVEAEAQLATPDPLEAVPKSDKPKARGKDWETRHQVATEHIKNVEAENSLLRTQTTQVNQQLQQMQAQLDKLSKTKEEPKSDGDLKAVDQPAERSKEHQEFLKDFPVINEVIATETKNAISRELATLLPEFMTNVRGEFGVLLKERSDYQRALNAQKRHQLTNERLGITNALEIDNSQQWGQWVSASPQRLKIAQAGVMDGHESYEQAAEDFAALMREFLMQKPEVGKVAETTAAPQSQSAPPRPRTAAPVRTPNAAAPRTRAKSKLTENSTMAEMQAYWDSQPKQQAATVGPW